MPVVNDTIVIDGRRLNTKQPALDVRKGQNKSCLGLADERFRAGRVFAVNRSVGNVRSIVGRFTSGGKGDTYRWSVCESDRSPNNRETAVAGFAFSTFVRMAYEIKARSVFPVGFFDGDRINYKRQYGPVSF